MSLLHSRKLKERKDKKEKLHTSKMRTAKARAKEEYTPVTKEVKKFFSQENNYDVGNWELLLQLNHLW